MIVILQLSESSTDHGQAFHRVCYSSPNNYYLAILINTSGLAWHTDDNALRQKFEEFGAVEEAVGLSSFHQSR